MIVREYRIPHFRTSAFELCDLTCNCFYGDIPEQLQQHNSDDSLLAVAFICGCLPAALRRQRKGESWERGFNFKKIINKENVSCDRTE